MHLLWFLAIACLQQHIARCRFISRQHSCIFATTGLPLHDRVPLVRSSCMHVAHMASRTRLQPPAVCIDEQGLLMHPMHLSQHSP